MNCPPLFIAESPTTSPSEPQLAPSRDGAAWSIWQKIARQAGLHPEARALSAGATNLSYRELEVRATQLANHLCSLGVGAECLVALCLERSPKFVFVASAIMRQRAKKQSMPSP